MKLTHTRNSIPEIVGLLWLSGALCLNAVAGNETWTGAAGNNNWNTGGNWTGANTPPAAGDILAFDAPSAGGLTLNNNLTINTFGGLTFNATAPAFVLNGNAITQTGATVDNSLSLETINLPMAIGASQAFTVAGGFQPGSNPAGGSLTLNNVVSGAGSIVKAGGGLLTLTGQAAGTNTYSGGTTINAGTLELDFSQGGSTPAGGILASGALTLGGGALTVNGASGAADSQTFTGTTLNAGQNIISAVNGASGGTATVTLNGLAANPGASVVFNGPASATAGVAATGTITTTTAGQGQTTVNVDGILATGAGNNAYATVGLYDWATTDSGATTAGTTVVGGSSISGFYLVLPNHDNEGSQNYDVATQETLAFSYLNTAQISANVTPYTVRFNTGNAPYLDVRGAGAPGAYISSYIQAGGVLVTPNLGPINAAIGSLNLQNSTCQIVQNNTLGVLVIGISSTTTAYETAFTGQRAWGTAGAADTTDFVVKSGAGTMFLNPIAGTGIVVNYTNSSGAYTVTTNGLIHAGTYDSYEQALYTSAAFYLNGGVMAINNGNQLGEANATTQGSTPGAMGTLNLNGGTLMDVMGSINLINTNAGSVARPVFLGDNGGGLAAQTTNTLTIPGVISAASGTGPLTIGIPASSANGNTVGLVPGTGTNATGSYVTMNPAFYANGTVALTGANTYPGNTIITSGTLQLGVGGSIVSPNIIVGTGATLMGSGTVNGLVTLAAGGTLAPGNPSGTLTINNNLALVGSSVMNYVLGTNMDSIAVNSNLTFAGIVNITAGEGFGSGTYTLATYKSLTWGSPTFGTTPAGYGYAFNTNTPGQVNLVVLALTITPPTATSIIYGQTLSSSSLSGGSASTPGTFAFTVPGIIPNAGVTNVSVTFTPTDTTNYTRVTMTVSVTVNQALATVTLNNLSQTYDGTAKLVAIETVPPGLNVLATYNGLASAPTNAGSYTVIGTVSNANYLGGATNTLVIGQAGASVTISNLTRYYDGTAKPVTTGTTPAGLTVNVTYNGTNGVPSDLGSYAVIGTISDTNYYGSATNTLVIKPVLPFITQQPTNQAVVVGSPLTFSVTAGGTGPLGYQWQKNSTPLADGGTISGSSTTNLTVSAVSAADAGIYSVVVTNVGGSVISSNAQLTVNGKIYVVGTNVVSGGIVSVPLKLNALGEEISLQFSLNYNPVVLTFLGVDDLSVLVTTNSPLPGTVGLTFQNFAGYSLGDQLLVNVVFAASPVTSNTVSAVTFGNVPVGQEVIDSSFNVLTNMVYNGGSVTVIPAEYAADVFPYPGGDSNVDLRDWAELGRLVTGLDATTNADLMLRADCAPRGNPDGILTVADWVQAGRYAAKLDPLTIVNLPGPASQVKSLAAAHPMGGSLTLVQMTGSTATNGQTVTVPVNLVASGSENALGFNVAFDATKLAFQGVTKGSAAGSTVMNINTNQALSGRLGITMSLSSGHTFGSGTNQLALLGFTLLNMASGNLPVNFSATNPVVQQVCNVNAGVMSASYTSAVIIDQTLAPPKPTLQIQMTNGMVNLIWPQSYSNFTLQSAGNIGSGIWNSNLSAPSIQGSNLFITMPATNAAQFFRLSQ